MKAKSRYPLAVISALSVLFGACQSKAPKNVPAATTAKTASTPSVSPAVDKTGATQCRIDGAASDVHILVFRGGSMARLGHNHVVSSKEASGAIWLHQDLGRSLVELQLPVATLIVDDPKARATEGEEFAAEVPQDAREGTRKNLLRAEVLDGEKYPNISARSTRVAGSRARPELTMRITIKGVEREVTVPASVREAGSRLTATGEFSIKQTDFGITPFSVALGALRVEDQLRIKFSLVCLKQQ